MGEITFIYSTDINPAIEYGKMKIASSINDNNDYLQDYFGEKSELLLNIVKCGMQKFGASVLPTKINVSIIGFIKEKELLFISNPINDMTNGLFSIYIHSLDPTFLWYDYVYKEIIITEELVKMNSQLKLNNADKNKMKEKETQLEKFLYNRLNSEETKKRIELDKILTSNCRCESLQQLEETNIDNESLYISDSSDEEI